MATMVHTGDGQLLLYGGRSDSGRTLNDLWAFDTHAQQWSQVKPTGNTLREWRQQAATVLPNHAQQLASSCIVHVSMCCSYMPGFNCTHTKSATCQHWHQLCSAAPAAMLCAPAPALTQHP